MKDFAKSIVCNTKVGNKAEVVKDGNVWVVLYAEGTKSKEFDSEAEAKKFAAQVGNSKVGNRTASEIEKEIAEVEASIDSHHRAGENPPKNLEERLKKLKAELANAKTGNSTEKLFHGLSKDAEKEEEKSDEALDELKKTGNATPNYRYKGFLITNPEGEYVVFLQDGIHVAFRGTRSKAMAEDWCDWHDPKTGKVLNSKAGNAKIGNQSPQERLNQDLSIIKEKCREKGVSLSFSELAKELEKYGWDFNELRKLKLPVSIGNSASDDKFAYVMREFDEGKLKTPDGKVVTDPQQAKAIAYSESKKTENGLARARNAIKKNS